MKIQNVHTQMTKKKTPKNFRFTDLTIRKLEKIAEMENKSLTAALEFMIQEKADYYAIVLLQKKEKPSGAFPYGAGVKK